MKDVERERERARGRDADKISQISGIELNRSVDLQVVISEHQNKKGQGSIFVNKLRGKNSLTNDGDSSTSDLVHRSRTTALDKLSESTEMINEQQNLFTLSSSNEVIEKNITGFWFDKLSRGGESEVTEAEQLIVQSETMRNEVDLIELWSLEVQGLVKLYETNSKESDVKEAMELNLQMEELSRDVDIKKLGNEVIAAVINKSERGRLFRSKKISRANDEQQLLAKLNLARVDLNVNLFEKLNFWEEDAKKCFSVGGKLLKKFGELMEKACSFANNDTNFEIFKKLHENGLDVGRIKSADAYNKFHRKITLNSTALNPFCNFLNGDLTMVNIAEPLPDPFYVIVRATEGPWSVQRSDKPFIKETLLNTIKEIAQNESVKSATSLTQLATSLDVVHPGGFHEKRMRSLIYSKNVSESGYLLQERLKALGYIINEHSFNAFHKDGETREWVIDMLFLMNERLEKHGRFYYEVHPHSIDSGKLTEWMIGYSWADHEEAGDEQYIGESNKSVAVSSSGHVFHAGKKYTLVDKVFRSRCVGILLDILTGTIVFYDEGRMVGSIFGIDSACFSHTEQLQQGHLVRTQHMVPVLSIRGRSSESANATKLGFGNKMGFREKTNSDSKKTNSRRRSSTRGFSNRNVNSVKEESSNSEIDANLANKEEAVPINNNVTSSSLVLAYEAKLPALSVNFGGYAFAYRPFDTDSCDAYLSLSEAKSNASVLDANIDDNEPHNFETYKDRIAILEAGQQQQTNVNMKLNNENIPKLQRRALFLASLKYKEPNSWSNFPPKFKVLERATIVLQRAARRMIAKKWRKEIIKKRRKMILKIEKMVRINMPRRRYKKRKAATNIQRIWRGYLGRHTAKLVTKYGIVMDELNRHVIKIQSVGRMYLAKKKTTKQRGIRNLQIKHLHKSANIIAEAIRAYLTRIKILLEIKRNHASLQIQALFRGYATRKVLFSDDLLRKRLFNLGKSVLLNKKKRKVVIQIQRFYRGFKDRQYVKIRKNVFDRAARTIQKGWRSHTIRTNVRSWYDHTLANIILRFLRGIKVIYFKG